MKGDKVCVCSLLRSHRFVLGLRLWQDMYCMGALASSVYTYTTCIVSEVAQCVIFFGDGQA